MIKKSKLRVEDKLKEILDFSENLRTDIQISEISLNQLFDESVSRVRNIKDSDKIEKQFTILNDTAFYSDYYRMSIILSYILSNSIQYRDEKKEKQFVRVSALISETQASFSIWDNGVGIQSDRLPNVFDMFVRSNESSDGAGLDLYVAKDLIEKLNSTITIASAFGEWTQVNVALPNHNKPIG